MNYEKNLAELNYVLGGMENTDRPQEVVYVLEQVDGVERAVIEQGNKLNVIFDQNVVHEDYLKSTLSSLGHGILNRD